MARRNRRRSGGSPRAGTQIYLFTDLVGSTRLFERLGDDIADPLIRKHLKELGWSVAKNGGRVVKSLGDGLMAVFSSATSAIDCSIEMQQHIHWQNVATPEQALGLRVGIHAGEATYDGSDYYGAAVWVARRMCDIAGTGEILCSDVFKRLLGGRGGHDLRERGEVEVKGVNEPVHTWVIVWTPGGKAPDLSVPKYASPISPLTVAGAVIIGALVVGWAVWQYANPASDARAKTVPVAKHEVDDSAVDIRSGEPAIGDGTIVAFSALDRLVRDDHDGRRDVYVRLNKTTKLVSAPIEGRVSTGASGRPSISVDGPRIVFESTADNLVADDANGSMKDVFVYDADKDTLEIVSLRNNGNPGRGPSMAPDISANGDFVAFASDAPNLALVGDDNDARDIFLRNLRTHSTNRVSLGPDNGEADGPSYSPSVSSSGRFIAFASEATNLVDGDTNGVTDVFVYDKEARTTERVSVASDGTQGDAPSYEPSISEDGHLVAFASEASNLTESDDNGEVDIFLYDGNAGATTLVTHVAGGASADEPSYDPSMSDNGKYVAFTSEATDLLDEPVDEPAQHVYMWSREDDTIVAIDVNEDDEPIDAASSSPAISSDGLFVAFVTRLSALLDEEDDPILGVFLRGPLVAR